MRKKLFEEVFKKAEERSPSKTRNGVCAFLENAFYEMDRYSFGKETFIRYYKKYREGKNIKYNPNAELLNKCAQYLGYEDYEDFVLKNKNENPKEKDDDEKPPFIILPGQGSQENNKSEKESEFSKGKNTNQINLIIWIQKNKKLVIINIIVLIAIIITISTDVLSKNQKKWMIWDENKYTETEFNLADYYNDLLVPYDQNKIDFFKEIENPDCNTEYFNGKGEAKLWYYKVGKGNLELYTGDGSHPVHGKNLRPITRYMIREHICPEY